MELFVRLTRWADFLGGELSSLEVDEREAEAKVSFAEASALVMQWGARNKDDTITLAKAHGQQDRDVIKAQDALQVVYAKRKLTNSIYTAVDRDAAAVSRELTRRLGRNDRESRADRWRP